MMSHCRHLLLRIGLVSFASLVWLSNVLADERVEISPPLAGYADYQTLSSQIATLARSDVVAAASLGRTLGSREVHVLTIGTGQVDAKPAFLVVGNVHAPHLVGSEMAIRVARQLAEGVREDPQIKEFLNRCTVYIIPRPNPDGSERCLTRKPWTERDGNDRRTDDDRDGEFGEDPPDDLNGDGWITMMRVLDATGGYMPHAADARVMIKADPKKNERGRYRLLIEGRDNDRDEAFGEDGSRGVSLNRNFTFKYPYFKPGAGPHQVSEVESRAVADFALDHPNIAYVLTFTPEDNLFHRWKPDSKAERSRVKTTLLSADAPYQDFVAARYRKDHGGKDAPVWPKGEGSFSQWAYFHYGRWSLAARAWWVPKLPAEQTGADKKSDGEAVKKLGQAEQTGADKKSDGEAVKELGQAEKKPSDEKKPSAEKRGEADINALRWFAKHGIDGFVDWTPLENHPDFPGKKVEVGGFKPFYRLNPPAEQLDKLAERHTKFLVGLSELLPHAKIHEVKTEPLGSGVFRITAVVVNERYLPTMSEMGRISKQLQPLQIELGLPEKTTLIRGHRRVQLDRLPGNGGRAETTWIIRIGEAGPATAKIRVWMPTVGDDHVDVELK